MCVYGETGRNACPTVNYRNLCRDMPWRVLSIENKITYAMYRILQVIVLWIHSNSRQAGMTGLGVTQLFTGHDNHRMASA